MRSFILIVIQNLFFCGTGFACCKSGAPALPKSQVLNHDQYRKAHLLRLLDLFDRQVFSIPLDHFLKTYFRAHKAIGSKDRKAIAETAYGMVRWRGLLDALCASAPSWQERFELYRDFSPEDYLYRKEIAAHVRVSFPHWLFSLLEEQYGMDGAMNICASCNTKAPLTIRANALKITRDALLAQLGPQWEASSCERADHGIIVGASGYIQGEECFRRGLFEVQDEGSQLVADLVRAKPKDWVLDYCAGAGGKSLAIAPKLQGRGQLFLHDVRASALREAKLRLRRAGIQNAQCIHQDKKPHMGWERAMDWVLVDAPCSGTGTLRRNPERKWSLTQEQVDACVRKQREIFTEAFSCVKPGGYIVYATCSILAAENEEQVAWCEKRFPLERKESFTSLPQKGGMDGFFAIVWRCIL